MKRATLTKHVLPVLARLGVRPWSWLVLALLAWPAPSWAQAATGVGFQLIAIDDPVNGGTMPGYVFYPSAHASGVTWVGPYELHATRDAPANAGAKPLVVISHGHGGSAVDLHAMATHLASHGFVVATLQHPRDNYLDTSGAGMPVVLDGRPIQVKATISMLLDSPDWKALIDPERIGVAGFSAGGYTALLVVGAVPRFDRYIGFCKQYPRNEEMCDGMEQAESTMGVERMAVYFAGVQFFLHHWGDPRDPRVKAAFAMDPVSFFFDKAGLASIDRPVFLYYPQDSQVLPPAANAARIAPMMKTLAGIKMIPKADHFVFLGPCTEPLAKAVPALCKDPPGVNRAEATAQINADALAFFTKTLVAPRQ